MSFLGFRSPQPVCLLSIFQSLLVFLLHILSSLQLYLAGRLEKSTSTLSSLNPEDTLKCCQADSVRRITIICLGVDMTQGCFGRTLLIHSHPWDITWSVHYSSSHLQGPILQSCFLTLVRVPHHCLLFQAFCSSQTSILHSFRICKCLERKTGRKLDLVLTLAF